MEFDNVINGSSFTRDYHPPSHLTADYLHIIYLAAVFLAGVPLNFCSLLQLIRSYKATKSRIILLSIHLNVSDTMTLFFYAFVKICWLFTYRWLAGNTACKLVKFLQTLSFCLSSNVVVCIGLDRLCSLLKPLQIKMDANRRCKRMLVLGWTLAALCSAPQLHVWTVYRATDQWSQCVDIWQMSDRRNSSAPLPNKIQTVYNVCHLVAVFWLPLFIVISCYAIILKKVYSSLETVSEAEDDPDHPVQIETVDENTVAGNNGGISKKRNGSNGSRTGGGGGGGGEGGRGGGVPRYSVAVTLNNNDEYRVTTSLRRHVSTHRIKRAKFRTLQTSVMIVLAYVCFWLPYNSLALWSFVDYDTYKPIENYVYLFYGLISVNAVINPLIYSRFSLGRFCKGRRAKTDYPIVRQRSVKFAI